MSTQHNTDTAINVNTQDKTKGYGAIPQDDLATNQLVPPPYIN